MSKPEDVRLYAILARKSPRAVLFRRGPSKRVLLISRDTSEEVARPGTDSAHFKVMAEISERHEIRVRGTG